MAGPLTKVDTTVAAISLDISRKLNWGKGLSLEFIVPDQQQMDKWRIVGIIKKGFDRVTDDERTQNDGSDVIFEVADINKKMGLILRNKDLHVRVNTDIYKVGKVAPVPPNVAQVFTLNCKTRTVRTKFDTTK